MGTLNIERRQNDRGYIENFIKGRHLKLEDLKRAAPDIHLYNKYLKNDIPDYPRPEFHVFNLKHDTDKKGLKGIRKRGGFMNHKRGSDGVSLQWFSLFMGPVEIESAERRLLETTYPDRTDKQIQNQKSFLEKFATSPAFDRSSRLGSYRFTFSVEEVLEAYKDQFCSGAEPVMRVMETVLHRQEVVYAVLVHSPANQEQFSEYPLLADNDNPEPTCIYKDGCFKWRFEAMCGTHIYKLVKNDTKKTMKAVKVVEDGKKGYWYVWDHVAIALHVDDQVLKFNQLREKLTFCPKAKVTLNCKKTKKKTKFQNFQKAQDFVRKLWPHYPLPLMRGSSGRPAPCRGSRESY